MGESVATRVDEATKAALEQTADDRDESVSSVAADVLEQWATDDGDDTDDTDDADELVRRTTLEDGDHAADVAKLRADLDMVIARCRQLTKEQRGIISNASGVYMPPNAPGYPPLPGDRDDGDESGSDRPEMMDELGL